MTARRSWGHTVERAGAGQWKCRAKCPLPAVFVVEFDSITGRGGRVNRRGFYRCAECARKMLRNAGWSRAEIDISISGALETDAKGGAR